MKKNSAADVGLSTICCRSGSGIVESSLMCLLPPVRNGWFFDPNHIAAFSKYTLSGIESLSFMDLSKAACPFLTAQQTNGR